MMSDKRIGFKNISISIKNVCLKSGKNYLPALIVFDTSLNLKQSFGKETKAAEKSLKQCHVSLNSFQA